MDSFQKRGWILGPGLSRAGMPWRQKGSWGVKTASGASLAAFGWRTTGPALSASGRVVQQVFAGGLGFHAVMLRGPGPQVDGLAALAAEGAVGVVGAVDVRDAAGRAAHLGTGARTAFPGGPGGGGHGGILSVAARVSGSGREAQAQSVNSKLASVSDAILSLPSASGRIRRMDTIRRLALISGTRPRAGSMRRRSRWKLRESLRFCWYWPQGAATMCG